MTWNDDDARALAGSPREFDVASGLPNFGEAGREKQAAHLVEGERLQAAIRGMLKRRMRGALVARGGVK